MRIHVRYFAYFREQIGHSHEWIDVPPGTGLAALWQTCTAERPQLTARWDAAVVAVNGEYAARDAALRDGDEVSFLPPVSGGGARCMLTAAPLDATLLEASVASPQHGAVVTFLGIVRETSPTGNEVEYLEYEAFEGMAEREMERIADEVESRWPGSAVAIAHRTGRLAIGEASVAISVATPHRAAAFDACRFAIDRLKEIVPIWKKEVFLDGGQWVGIGS